MRRVARPTGTVTFLFTDVEGSTHQWEADGVAADAALVEHDALLVGVIDRHGGYVFARGGDSFAAAFVRASDAVGAAVEAQRALEECVGGLRVRMGLHTGEAVERDGDYFGPAVNHTARIMASGHGGQVLLSNVTTELVPGIRTVDLGLHTLAGIDGRVGIRQLVIKGVQVDFPPLRSSHDTPTNLPSPRTSFVGRDEELERVVALLGAGRLVTLVGTGGAGKTRLAVEAARHCFWLFDDGVWFAGLADVSDADAGRFDGRAGDGQARSVGRGLHGARATRLLRWHRPAAAGVGQLRACVGRVRGAGDRSVGPLRWVGGVGDESGVARRARRATCRGRIAGAASRRRCQCCAGQRGRIVVRLPRPVGAFGILRDRRQRCQRCRVVPSTGRLAAGAGAGCEQRCRVLTPAQLIERLDGAFGVLGASRDAVKHHETLLATLTWSYDLLGDSERRLFRRLGVFRGGFRLEAAEAVSVGEDRAHVLDDLASLIDKSMVTVVGEDPDGARRCVLLEVVREYALWLLIEHGERPEAEQRHFEDLLLACSELNVSERGSPRWAVLRAELDNVRRVVGWALDQGNAAAALRLIAAYPCWLDSGLLHEQVELAATTFDRVELATLPAATFAAALVGFSIDMSYLGDEQGAHRANARLASLLAEHPDDLSVRAGSAYALATQEGYFAGHDLLSAHRHLDEAQSCNDAAHRPNAIPAGNQAVIAVCFGVDPPNGFATTIDAALTRARLASGPVLSLPCWVWRRCTTSSTVTTRRCLAPRPIMPSYSALARPGRVTFSAWWSLRAGSTSVTTSEAPPPCSTSSVSFAPQACRSSSRLLYALRLDDARTATPRQATRLWRAASHLAATTGMRELTALADLDARLHDGCRQKFSASELDGLDREGGRWTLNQVLDIATAEFAPR